ncbi:MAG: 50S ribosomal protein L29, partial [Bacteroidota bacterium]|nr:50S ribosomal protein L29 [Bacteroidota bacterium]MDX5429414.1 50S ribosomal protein L29 [Bacteroidota bacterium]MDX5468205.1 50S ribosomal protein L29 [Bacteroidota bacterium]
MQIKEIKGLTTEEIVVKLREERALYTKMKFNHAVSPLENPLKLRASRKVIARYLTELNARK